MTEKKNAKGEEKKLHRHGSPVIHVESGDEGPSGPMVESDDESVFHPGRHGTGIIGAVPRSPEPLARWKRHHQAVKLGVRGARGPF
jgi:hypothetical protein